MGDGWRHPRVYQKAVREMAETKMIYMGLHGRPFGAQHLTHRLSECLNS